VGIHSIGISEGVWADVVKTIRSCSFGGRCAL
jgi:hypothetical protein